MPVEDAAACARVRAEALMYIIDELQSLVGALSVRAERAPDALAAVDVARREACAYLTAAADIVTVMSGDLERAGV